jgi:hypothetical protein
MGGCVVAACSVRPATIGRRADAPPPRDSLKPCPFREVFRDIAIKSAGCLRCKAGIGRRHVGRSTFARIPEIGSFALDVLCYNGVQFSREEADDFSGMKPPACRGMERR